MKSYWDLTAKERLNLTHEQLNEVWIPREAAMQGLLRPAEPSLIPLPEKPDVQEPSQMPHFKVKGRYNGHHTYEFAGIFDSLETAKGFIALRPRGYERKYRDNDYSNSFHIMLTLDSYDVEIINVVDEAEQKAYDSAMQEYAEAKVSNDKQLDAHTRALRAIENSAEKLRKNLQKLNERKNMLASVIHNLKEFITVAEGDFKMACRFMLKKIDRQLLYDALQEHSEIEGFTWTTVEIFGADCLIEDLNPYRDIDPSGMTTL